jgi:hypothetical protein
METGIMQNDMVGYNSGGSESGSLLDWKSSCHPKVRIRDQAGLTRTPSIFLSANHELISGFQDSYRLAVPLGDNFG